MCVVQESCTVLLRLALTLFFFFFFQAEDGIRDLTVTGVQTCVLPISHCKPDGLLHVPATQTIGFLEPLPVGRLWGVGEKTADLLGRLAIRTIGDLARTPEQVLQRLVGEVAARHLTQLAHGLDEREVIPYEAPKSIGHEETFDRGLDDDGMILRELMHPTGRVASSIDDDNLCKQQQVSEIRLEMLTQVNPSGKDFTNA